MNEPTQEPTQAPVPLSEAQNEPYTQPRDEPGGAMTGVEAERRAGSARNPREPLARADRIQIAMLAGLFAMLAAMLAAGAVGFTTLSGQILGLQKQVGDLRTEVHEEIGGLRTEMHKEIGGLRTEMQKEIGGLRTGMQKEIGGLRTGMQKEIGELSDRMTRVETLIRTHFVPQTSVLSPAGP